MQSKLISELSANDVLSDESKIELEELIGDIKLGMIGTTARSMIWAFTNPPQSGFVEKNILRLYSEKESNDCRKTNEFGFRLLDLLRKLREILYFYDQTQQVPNKIDWRTESHEALNVIYQEVQNCLQ